MLKYVENNGKLLKMMKKWGLGSFFGPMMTSFWPKASPRCPFSHLKICRKVALIVILPPKNFRDNACSQKKIMAIQKIQLYLQEKHKKIPGLLPRCSGIENNSSGSSVALYLTTVLKKIKL